MLSALTCRCLATKGRQLMHPYQSFTVGQAVMWDLKEEVPSDKANMLMETPELLPYSVSRLQIISTQAAGSPGAHWVATINFWKAMCMAWKTICRGPTSKVAETTSPHSLREPQAPQKRHGSTHCGGVRDTLGIGFWFTELRVLPSLVLRRMLRARWSLWLRIQTRTGWVAGGGVEWAAWTSPRSSVTLKLEYLYVDLGTASYFSSPVPLGAGVIATRNVSLTNNIIRAGVNWKFNWF